jgi:hypothetical protein
MDKRNIGAETHTYPSDTSKLFLHPLDPSRPDLSQLADQQLPCPSPPARSRKLPHTTSHLPDRVRQGGAVYG